MADLSQTPLIQAQDLSQDRSQFENQLEAQQNLSLQEHARQTIDQIALADSIEININDEDNNMCRICFEDDYQYNMFQPCKCFGDQRWVHRDCLDQWRATSPNPEAFSRCLTCQYEYKMEVKSMESGCLGKTNQSVARNSCFLCMMILMSIILGGLFSRWLDHGRVIYQFFKDHIYNHPHGDEYYYYYVFTGYVYLILVILTTLINIIRMKNRLMYIKYLLGYNWVCGLIRIVIILVLTILTFYLNVYLGCVILTMEIQSLIQVHYIFLHYLYRANRNRILPYRDQNGNTFLEGNKD